MPELPEVETIKRGLAANLVGQTIKSVQVIYSKPDIGAAAQGEFDLIAGHWIEGIDRRGKVLIVQLATRSPKSETRLPDSGLRVTDYSLLVHLKMTGQLVLIKAGGVRLAGGHPTASMSRPLPDASTRIVFEFESGDRLYFNDQRKFGWIKIAQNAQRDTLIAKLGPEPLSDDFSVKRLAQSVGRRARSPIKAVILDQTVVAGVGNIYADESLHLAKIHPSRLAGSLTMAEIKRLHQAIRETIALGIDHGGTSLANYVNVMGGKGDYLDHARVFRQHQGGLCPVCGTPIEKIRVAGRGTHFCPKCQRLSHQVKSPSSLSSGPQL